MAGKMRTKMDFTLIELLIVVAIIGILMSMLLPAIGGAKALAKGIGCCSNLKQQGFATASYANDSNGYLLTLTYWDDSNGERWKNYIIPYIMKDGTWANNSLWKNRGVFKCPSWDWVMVNTLGGVAYDGGYAWDFCVGRGYDNTGNGRRRRLENLVNISQTILIGDSVNNPDTVLGTSNAYYCSVIYPPLAFSADFTSPKHRSGWNNLWADFHVDWQARSFLLRGVSSDPLNDPPIYNAGDYYYYPHTR